MQKTYVHGPQHAEPSEVYKDADGCVGQVVYSESRKVYTQRTLLFLSDEGSRDMNIDGSSSGTPDPIHNGIDNVYWTAAASVGTWDFNNNTQANTGTYSIRAWNMNDNDKATISKGSDLDFGNFEALTGYLYISRVTVATQQFNVWFEESSLSVGNSVDLLDYVTSSTTGSWQKFTIPKADFGIESESIDDFVIGVGRSANPRPRFYLDDIQIEETSGTMFTAQPAQGKKVEYQRVELYLEDALDISVTNGTAPGLSLTQLLGITPTVGFSFQRFEGGVPQISLTFKTLSDLNSLTFRVVDVGCDGTNTFLKMESILPEPATLKELDGDKVVITINDDFTGLLNFRALLIGKELID